MFRLWSAQRIGFPGVIEIRSRKGKEMVKLGFTTARLGTPPAFHLSARGCAASATPGKTTQQLPSLKGLDHKPLGRLALARHKLRRPRSLPSFNQLARLLQIGFDFGRLACALGSPRPAPVKVPHFEQPEQALARAYGSPFELGTD